eukprot:6142720-Amphidinium_carterae.1
MSSVGAQVEEKLGHTHKHFLTKLSLVLDDESHGQVLGKTKLHQGQLHIASRNQVSYHGQF